MYKVHAEFIDTKFNREMGLWEAEVVRGQLAKTRHLAKRKKEAVAGLVEVINMVYDREGWGV